MSSDESTAQTMFSDLNLIEPVLQALTDVGYETPTPIQEEIIPHVLNGDDVLGQAQTGTGKTAAFALPILSKIDLDLREPQVLVLAPTRELAIQVAEAFHNYAKHMKGFHVLPIYGGQDIGGQLRQLKRGVHVVVATPGRVMDHMRRGSLKFKDLRSLVLDEADEMLRMGFIDDVEWILDKTPDNRQVALFSATMPTVIRRIAQKYLNDPKEITIKVKTATASTIRQRYWMVSGFHKLDALTRILEAETFDAIIIFVRTKTTTVELAEKLDARGYAAAALNGDIPQNQRERTVERLKTKKLDILIATDVAARGLDVERISHVINYDIPYDTEAYVHRIGRTGRAGRKGDAILFVAPRERRMLKSIERATRQTIDLMQMPSTETINDKRVAEFKQRISDTLAMGNLGFFTDMMEQYRQEHNIPALDVAAALAKMVQGDTPLLLTDQKQRAPRERNHDDRDDRGRGRGGDDRGRGRGDDRGDRPQRPRSTKSEEGMARYRVDVGKSHQVKPGNIMGAILNEVDMEREFVGRIEIYDDYSTVDLPEGMPNEILTTLKKVWVAGCQLNMSLDTGKDEKRSYGKKDNAFGGARRKSFSQRRAAPSSRPRKRRS
ncbi:MAG: DEAD/DEAH box helicase [Mariprofundaceae bacterium]|nr:DEAD/DEAH box helicase [Mariprofundaceae bacterium]